jgi:hypothetical protein
MIRRTVQKLRFLPSRVASQPMHALRDACRKAFKGRMVSLPDTCAIRVFGLTHVMDFLHSSKSGKRFIYSA